jgi:hypothetical protein
MNKKAVIIAFLIVAIFVAILCLIKDRPVTYKSQYIDIKTNEYSLSRDQDIDIDFRMVEFYWDFVPEEPDMPAYSQAVVHKDYVNQLIDDVCREHLNPQPNPETGETSRRLVGVNIHEPVLETNMPLWGVPELDWKSVATWHRN